MLWEIRVNEPRKGEDFHERITGRSAFLHCSRTRALGCICSGIPAPPNCHHERWEHPDLTYVMAMQESLVGRLPTLAAGLAASSPATSMSRPARQRRVRCSMPVLLARRMILTAGQQEQGHGLMEPVLYGPMLQMVEPL
jgi:benzoylformate decarboxylase